MSYNKQSWNLKGKKTRTNWSNYCILEISVSSTRRKTDKHPDMVLQHLHYNVNIMVTIFKNFSFLQLPRASIQVDSTLFLETHWELLPTILFSWRRYRRHFHPQEYIREFMYTKADLEKGPAASLCKLFLTENLLLPTWRRFLRNFAWLINGILPGGIDNYKKTIN